MNLALLINTAGSIILGARDVFDILVVATLIYVAIIVFQRTHSTPVAVGALTLLAVYGLSMFFGLRISKEFLGSFFGFFMIIIAIIFQKELRRFFEIISIIGIKTGKFSPYQILTRTMVKTSEVLIQKKIGALFVFPGRENFDRHLEGGFYLGGRISEPLLLSIFDPSSPGHDGAAIIENDTIRKFAVHLPLAENVDAVKNFGTRHRAALGLSEVSDALVVVVSEEKGTVSMCRDKKFKTLKNAKELKDVLNEFFEEKFPQSGLIKSQKWLRKNLPPIALSLVSAAVLWLIFK